MGHSTHVTTHDTGVYEETLKAIKEEGGRGAKAASNYQRTGQLDEAVDIFGATRSSRNAMTPEGDKFILVNGVAVPLVTFFDGTSSMGELIEIAVDEIRVLYDLLSPVRAKRNIQIASAMVQDYRDEHPVVQMAQFESDNKIEQWLNKILYSNYGHYAIEDYQLALAYMMLAVHDIDIFNHYGCKGFCFIVGDQRGRDVVDSWHVSQYLGHDLGGDMPTRQVCQSVMKRWHTYFLKVRKGGQPAREDDISQWWYHQFGSQKHVIHVPDPNLLAVIQATLVFMSELEPQSSQFGSSESVREQVIKFVRSADLQTKYYTQRDAELVWRAVRHVEVGVQSKLQGFGTLPEPGSVFDHWRNPFPSDDRSQSASSSGQNGDHTTDWAKI